VIGQPVAVFGAEPLPAWFVGWIVFVAVAWIALAGLAAWDVRRRGLPWLRVLVWGIVLWPVGLCLWVRARRDRPLMTGA
jgi:hypothetical protein